MTDGVLTEEKLQEVTADENGAAVENALTAEQEAVGHVTTEQEGFNQGTTDPGEMDNVTADQGDVNHVTVDQGDVYHRAVEEEGIHHVTAEQGDIDPVTADQEVVDYVTEEQENVNHVTSDQEDNDHVTVEQGESSGDGTVEQGEYYSYIDHVTAEPTEQGRDVDHVTVIVDQYDDNVTAWTNHQQQLRSYHAPLDESNSAECEQSMQYLPLQQANLNDAMISIEMSDILEPTVHVLTEGEDGDDEAEEDEEESEEEEEETDIDSTEVTDEASLALTMRMLYDENGSALLAEMPASSVFDLVRAVAKVVTAPSNRQDDLRKTAADLLDCSSTGNIQARLEAWPLCSMRLKEIAEGTSFAELFEASFDRLREELGREVPAVEEEEETVSTAGANEYYQLGECDICCSERGTLLWRRGCCEASICVFCLHRWLNDHVTDAQAKLGCPGCGAVFTVHQLRHLLSAKELEKREKLLARVHGNGGASRDCPRCSCFAQRPGKQERRVSKEARRRSERERGGVVVNCAQCEYVWCYECHSPAHVGFTCRQFSSGVHQLESWAKQFAGQSGLRKARRCPRCKAMIEKNEGCDHMTCANCKHEFCYKCGKRWKIRQMRLPLLHWSVFGGHSDRYSVFGCRRKLLRDRPATRRLVRGSLFVLRTLGLIAGGAVTVALLLAVLGIALPLSPILIPVIIFLAKTGRLRGLASLW